MSAKQKNTSRKRKETTTSQHRSHHEGEIGGRNGNGQSKRRSNHHSLKQDVDDIHNSPNVLWWLSTEPHVPLEREQDLCNAILRWGQKERGMLKDQPEFRVRQIRQRCQRNRIHLSQACSLRRHHMSDLNPFKSKEALLLGQSADIKASATLFEDAVAKFLQTKGIGYYTEQEQKAQLSQNNPQASKRGTPDFMMKKPIQLNVYSVDRRNNHRRRVHAERTIHWIEAKMFYGASTIRDPRGAVGSIPAKMKKYVEFYGQGAIVFSQGCGDALAAELAEIGVTALNCSGNEFDFSDLHRHQRTWCADQQGNILP
ncbi:expressed unknown protein [Seminavis robusta]|uniref:CDAN1-interacting nuclease 1 n=1 Tax=Seminavis robusta TaxID=568900 RepID=A0A9N8EL16_9STRA|nr:expressed unknown protein [Seminavis robusta]|eukprot:Sro1156_g247280.1 n/a (313) ;mRNA; r:16707-17645